MAGGVCSGIVVGGVAVVSVGGVAGSDQITSSAMTTVAAMMSNVFLSITIPLVFLPSRLLHSFSPLKVFAFGPGKGKGGRMMIPVESFIHSENIKNSRSDLSQPPTTLNERRC
jgi:hypothetical protein